MMNPCLNLFVLLLFVALMALEMRFVLQGHLEVWWPKIRQRFNVPPTPPDSLWRGLFFVGGFVGGIYVWVIATSHLSLHPIVDYIGKLISMGLGMILFLALFDGCLLVQELRKGAERLD